MNHLTRATSKRILLIDIGNTNLKWAWLVNSQLSAISSARHVDQSFTELADTAWLAESVPEKVLVANVAGDDIKSALNEWVERQWGLSPQFLVSPAADLGVRNAYQNPEQLGIDRWLTLVAAHARWDEPVCIVDCGTAITVDVIDVGGEHKGGVILPGFNLMREALLARTRIPRVSAADVKTLLSTDTASAVASAALHSAAALVERVLHQGADEFGQTPRLVMTGSDARYLLSEIDKQGEIESDLVMTGLMLVAEAGEE